MHWLTSNVPRGHVWLLVLPINHLSHCAHSSIDAILKCVLGSLPGTLGYLQKYFWVILGTLSNIQVLPISHISHWAKCRCHSWLDDKCPTLSWENCSTALIPPWIPPLNLLPANFCSFSWSCLAHRKKSTITAQNIAARHDKKVIGKQRYLPLALTRLNCKHRKWFPLVTVAMGELKEMLKTTRRNASERKLIIFLFAFSLFVVFFNIWAWAGWNSGGMSNTGVVMDAVMLPTASSQNVIVRTQKGAVLNIRNPWMQQTLKTSCILQYHHYKYYLWFHWSH